VTTEIFGEKSRILKRNAALVESSMPVKNGGHMGRTMGGFEVQNQIVKLQWAALEAVHMKVSSVVYRSLKGARDLEEPELQSSSEESDEPSEF
jgi:hypothetical protein